MFNEEDSRAPPSGIEPGNVGSNVASKPEIRRPTTRRLAIADFQMNRYTLTALPADFSLRNPPPTKIRGKTRDRGGAPRSFERLLLYCAVLRA
jgi:hypothetical protein